MWLATALKVGVAKYLCIIIGSKCYILSQVLEEHKSLPLHNYLTSVEQNGDLRILRPPLSLCGAGWAPALDIVLEDPHGPPLFLVI